MVREAALGYRGMRLASRRGACRVYKDARTVPARTVFREGAENCTRGGCAPQRNSIRTFCKSNRQPQMDADKMVREAALGYRGMRLASRRGACRVYKDARTVPARTVFREGAENCTRGGCAPQRNACGLTRTLEPYRRARSFPRGGRTSAWQKLHAGRVRSPIQFSTLM